jgi:hypothetical protein
MRYILLGFALCAFSWAQEKTKYDGPVPPKPDIPYLLHAANLIPTEAVQASQSDKKGDMVYSIAGATSPAKTPLAEPIFLIEADKLNPDHIELYRLEPKGGQREIMISRKAKRNGRPLRLMVSHIQGRLYRLEVAQTLENGEYSLSPADSNEAFCFTVF